MAKLDKVKYFEFLEKLIMIESSRLELALKKGEVKIAKTQGYELLSLLNKVVGNCESIRKLYNQAPELKGVSPYFDL